MPATPLDPIRRGVYVSDVLFLAAAIIRNSEKIFAEVQPGTLIIDNELPYLAASIAIDAARINKIIDNQRGFNSRFESRPQYEFRQRRVAIFQPLITQFGITEMLSSAVRNSLEHFDEHADKYLHDKRPGGSRTQRFVLSQNICVWDQVEWQQYLDTSEYAGNSIIAWIRAYIGSERTLYSLEGKINIQRVYEEAIILRDNLQFDGSNVPPTAQGVGIALL